MKFKLLLLSLLVSIVSYGQINIDLDKLNVRVAFGGPIIDTISNPYKLGELRTRPQDGLLYRYNGKTVGNVRWDNVYFGPGPNITPTLDQVLSRGNVSTLPITVGLGTFTGLKIPALGVTGQLLMATIGPDGTLGAQTIPGGGTLINSINGLTAPVQLLKVSYNVATSPSWVDVTATHTINLPIGSSVDTGIVTPAQIITWNGKTNLPGSGTSAKYLRGDTTWQTFPAIPAQLNPSVAGGGITITGTYPNLLFTVSSAGGTITSLVGDVTTSAGTGAVATTISNNVVSYAKMQQANANKLLGNPVGSTANVSEISLSSTLRFIGSTLWVDTGQIASLYQVGLRVKYIDTATMLATRMKYSDTGSLSTRINTKLSGLGTAGFFSYFGAANVISPSQLLNDTTNHRITLTGSYINILSNANSNVADLQSTVGASGATVGYNITGTSSSQYNPIKTSITAPFGVIYSQQNLSSSSSASSGMYFGSNNTQPVFVAYQNGSTTTRGYSYITGLKNINDANYYTIGSTTVQNTFSLDLIRIDSAGNTTLTGTGFLGLPIGTTAQRLPNPQNGWERYNTDSNDVERYHNGKWNVYGSGVSGSGGTCVGCLIAGNNLNDVQSVSTARTNLGLGALALLGSINNSNWSGAVLSPANGGTGLNNSVAGAGKILIGTGAGFALNNITANNYLSIQNGVGTINVTLDTNIVATRNWILSNPSTIAINQAGLGFNTLYTNLAGTTVFNRGLQSGSFITIVKNNDSSLTIASPLTYPQSVTVNSNVVSLVGDQASPGNSFLYSTSTTGVKQWTSFTSLPLAGPSSAGLFASTLYNKLTTNIKMFNYGSTYDSTLFASVTLDTIYGVRFNFNADATTFLTLSKTGSTQGLNKYTYGIDTTKIATRAYVLNNAGGTGAVTSLSSPGSTISLNQSTGAITLDVNAAHAYTWTAQHIFNNLAPIFGSLTVNGGILYTNGSGQVLQTIAGTSTGVLHGGTAPTYGGVVLTTDVSGILGLANGGSGTATPALVQGTNVTITGTWPAQTINSSNVYTADGTLSANRALAGGTFNFSVGTSGSKIGSLQFFTTVGSTYNGSTYNGSPGFMLSTQPNTITNGVTAANGSVSNVYSIYLAQQTINSTNTNVTYNGPTTLFIAGSPIGGTNSSFVAPLSLNVASGNSNFSGDVIITGNIISATWHGVAVQPAYGGSGLTTYTPNSILASGTTSTGNFQQVTPGTIGQYLKSNGSGAIPTWITPVTYSAGTYTSTFTNLDNISSSSFIGAGYTQTDHMVHVNLSGTVSVTAGNTYSKMQISIPPGFSPASGSVYCGAATFNVLSGSTECITGIISDGASTGVVTLEFMLHGKTTNVFFTASFDYFY